MNRPHCASLSRNVLPVIHSVSKQRQFCPRPGQSIFTQCCSTLALIGAVHYFHFSSVPAKGYFLIISYLLFLSTQTLPLHFQCFWVTIIHFSCQCNFATSYTTHFNPEVGGRSSYETLKITHRLSSVITWKITIWILPAMRMWQWVWI